MLRVQQGHTSIWCRPPTLDRAEQPEAPQPSLMPCRVPLQFWMLLILQLQRWSGGIIEKFQTKGNGVPCLKRTVGKETELKMRFLRNSLKQLDARCQGCTPAFTISARTRTPALLEPLDLAFGYWVWTGRVVGCVIVHLNRNWSISFILSNPAALVRVLQRNRVRTCLCFCAC